MIGRKGSLQDFFLIAVFILVASMIILIGFKVVTEFNTQVQGMSAIPAVAKTAGNTLVGHYGGVIDNTFLLVVIGMSIVVFILAAMVRVHPIFIPIFFIAWLLLIFLAGVFSNVYQTMAGQSEFIALATQLTFITNILTFLPFIVGVLGIVLMVVMYKTWQSAQF